MTPGTVTDDVSKCITRCVSLPTVDQTTDRLIQKITDRVTVKVLVRLQLYSDSVSGTKRLIFLWGVGTLWFLCLFNIKLYNKKKKNTVSGPLQSTRERLVHTASHTHCIHTLPHTHLFIWHRNIQPPPESPNTQDVFLKGYYNQTALNRNTTTSSWSNTHTP